MLVAPISRARAKALRTAASMTAALVRRSRSSRDGVDDGAGSQLAGGRHDRFAERHGRLADRGELDGIAAGALDRAADTRRHPEREIRRVHDRVDLELADVSVPEFDSSQGSSADASVRIPTAPAEAWYTRGRRQEVVVTTSQEFVVRARARSRTPIRSVPCSPMSTNSSSTPTCVPRHVRDVEHDRVHGDVADQRDPSAADERLGPVRERPRPAVAVAEGQRRDPAGPAGLERRAVRDPVAGRQVRDPDGPGLERHDRAESGGRRRQRRRIKLVGREAVGHEAGTDGVEPGHPGDEQPRARGEVAAGNGHPGPFQLGKRLLEDRDLGRRPGGILGCLQMRPDPGKADAGGSIDRRCRVRRATSRDAAAPEPRLDLQLHLELRVAAPGRRHHGEERGQQRPVPGRDPDPLPCRLGTQGRRNRDT